MVFNPDIKQNLPSFGATLPVANTQDEQFRNVIAGVGAGLSGIGSLQSSLASRANSTLNQIKYKNLLDAVPGIQEALGIQDPNVALVAADKFALNPFLDEQNKQQALGAQESFDNFLRINSQPQARDTDTSNLPPGIVAEASRVPGQLPLTSSPSGDPINSIPEDQRFSPATETNFTPGVPLAGAAQENVEPQAPQAQEQNLSLPDFITAVSSNQIALPEATKEAQRRLALFQQFKLDNPQAAARLEQEGGVFDTIKVLASIGQTVQGTQEGAVKLPGFLQNQRLAGEKAGLDIAAKRKEEEAKDRPFGDGARTVREAQEDKSATIAPPTFILQSPEVSVDDEKEARNDLSTRFPELDSLFSPIGTSLSPGQQDARAVLDALLAEEVSIRKDRGQQFATAGEKLAAIEKVRKKQALYVQRLKDQGVLTPQFGGR